MNSCSNISMNFSLVTVPRANVRDIPEKIILCFKFENSRREPQLVSNVLTVFAIKPSQNMIRPKTKSMTIHTKNGISSSCLQARLEAWLIMIIETFLCLFLLLKLNILMINHHEIESNRPVGFWCHLINQKPVDNLQIGLGEKDRMHGPPAHPT